jgi:PAS domain-containing protein
MIDIYKNILACSNIFVAAKDTSGRYIYCNDRVAEAVDLESPSQIIGMIDHNLCWYKQAELYLSGDRNVMKGNPYINMVEPQTQIGGVKKILISKMPLLNKYNNVIGVIGTYMDI